MASRRRAAPKRLWVIVDDDCEADCVDGILAWCVTRKEAVKECSRYNKLPGYRPTCRVVEYRSTEQTGATTPEGK